MPEKCCDKCQWYQWYYDFCEKWKCEIDARSCQDCFEERIKQVEEK